MQFEWHEEKNRTNEEKHGYGFRLASTAFYDPVYLQGPSRELRGEMRESIFGRAANGVLLFVVYTWRKYEGEKVCRIISARAAHKMERKR